MNQETHPLEILNLHVYYRIREYLTHMEYIYLLNTSKKLFSTIKFETIYVPLNRTNSQYYIQRAAFRTYMQNGVRNPGQQIGLSIPDFLQFRYPGVVRKLSIFCCNPPIKVEHLNHISYLRLNHDPTTTNFNGLVGVIKASISRFPNLTDLQGFRHTKGLDLSYCFVSDVTPLANLTKLSLSHCPNITDVSCLRNIRFLTLEECDEITSISDLSNVYDLKVLNCPSVELSHYQPLNHRFTLSHYQKLNLDYGIFANVKHLSLIDCQGLEIFFNVGNTISLEVKFTTPTIFGGVVGNNPTLKKFTLSNASFYLKSENFSYLHTLEFVDCDGIREVKHFGHIVNLTLNSCYQLQSLEGLGVGNYSVSIINCLKLYASEFARLNGIPKVRIENCSNFSNCQQVDRVQHLTLIGGMKLRGLRNLTSAVQSLTIDSASDLKSLFGLGTIPSIRIHNCMKLTNVRGLGESARQQKIVIGDHVMDDLYEVLTPYYSVERIPTYHVFLRKN